MNHYVTELKRLASIHGATKSLNMHYSTLYRLLTLCEKSVRVVTEENRKDAIDFYMKSQITQELLYKWFHDQYFMRAPLAVAYEQYVREAKRVGDRVLSKMSVYQCLRDDGRFKCRNKIPYKDCECDTCLNNSLIVDALIVAGVKGVVRSISRNILIVHNVIAQVVHSHV